MAKAKGVSLIDMVKFLRSKREVAAPLMPEKLRHYLDEQINVAKWYPEEDMIGLVRVLVHFLPAASESSLRQIGRLNARQHIAGAYAHLFGDVDLSVLPMRARVLWKAMHDTGDLQMSVGDGEATVELPGYGYPNAEMCEMIQSYLEELFLAGGLEKVEIAKRTCCLEGDPVCRYAVSWEAARAIVRGE